MYKFPNKHSDTVSIKQQFKYFIPGYVTVSHCESFAMYGKKKRGVRRQNCERPLPS